MEDNLIRLQNIVGRQLGIDPSEIKPEADFSKQLGADSLDVVELVMLIEDEFDIEIEDEVANQITTVRGALNYIEERETGGSNFG
ncbi:MAG: acyl carrier protein [Flavobacteriaceae bacterium]|nr:acyl carrier protein [Flavobacteriaceae bacterium]